jgi:membrane fusion protein, multidrug efflux system
MSEIVTRRSEQAGHSRWSGEVPVPSSNGAEPYPQLSARNDRDPSRKPGVGKPLILISAAIICVGIIAGIGYHLLAEETPATDKAVIEGYIYPISSRIDGTIAGLLVSNRQYVKAGDLLAEIDKRDLEAKLAAARTDLVQAQTILPGIEMQLSKAQAELEKAESKILHRDKELAEALSDYQYNSRIRNKKGVSPLLFSKAKKEYESALNEYLGAKMTLGREGDRVRETQTLKDATLAKMHTAETTVRQTETQLSSTKIYAPANGYVVFDKINFGRRLSAGEPFLKLIGDDPWVVANFNEDQLKRIKPGQRVTIRIDALKERTFQGKVASLVPVTRGSANRTPSRLSLFALLDPPQTAPVKIAFDSESVLGFEDHILPGLATIVEVDTGSPQD